MDILPTLVSLELALAGKHYLLTTYYTISSFLFFWFTHLATYFP